MQKQKLNSPSFGQGKEIIIQIFDWSSHQRKKNEKTLYQELILFFESHSYFPFTAVWMPPPWRDAYYSNGHGGSGYGWMDFKKDSAYGSEQDLKKLADIIHKKKIKIIYDIVINHRNSSKDHEVEAKIEEIWKKLGASQWADINKKKKENLGVDFGGQLNLEKDSPVLDVFASELVNLMTHYHAQGFRFDYAKGYHPETISYLMDKVKENLGPSKLVQDDFLFIAEYATTDELVLKKYAKASRCAMFDFPLFEKLRGQDFTFTNQSILHALNNHQNEQLRKMAVTFVGNHDADGRDDIYIHIMNSLPDLKNEDFSGHYIYSEEQLYYINDHHQAEVISIYDPAKFNEDLIKLLKGKLFKKLTFSQVQALIISNSDHKRKKKPLSVPKWLRKSAYMYILLSPGSPCVFWPHWQEKDELLGMKAFIEALIYIRQALGIHAASKIEFHHEVSQEGLLATVYGEKGGLTLALGEGIEKQAAFPKKQIYFSPNAGFLCFHDDEQAHSIMNALHPSCFTVFSPT